MRCNAKRNGLQCARGKGHSGNHRLPAAHHCHWPDCTEDVPPKMWGCSYHWFKLPKSLRNKIWATYKPGQEITKTPSDAYLIVANQVQEWIADYRQRNKQGE